MTDTALAPAKTAPLVIDVKEEFFWPGGPNELPAATQALRRRVDLLGAARDAGAHVVHVGHVSTHRCRRGSSPARRRSRSGPR